MFYIPQRYWFSSKSQQSANSDWQLDSCFIYHKGTDFQANHNWTNRLTIRTLLFYIPQRYWFSSKSQLDFMSSVRRVVVLYTTKVLIFKQITTAYTRFASSALLFYIPQRYWFSSKSQRNYIRLSDLSGCFIYHKGTDFQANHNQKCTINVEERVVLYTTKVLIFKQITTSSAFNTDLISCFIYHKGTDFQANHNKRLCWRQ